jgi:hypothetical protein
MGRVQNCCSYINIQPFNRYKTIDASVTDIILKQLGYFLVLRVSSTMATSRYKEVKKCKVISAPPFFISAVYEGEWSDSSVILYLPPPGNSLWYP